jgi:GxxExxY protein
MSAAVVQADQLNAITEQIIGAAMEVHRALGPGLLESAYEACLVFELRQRGLRVDQQKPLRSHTRM